MRPCFHGGKSGSEYERDRGERGERGERPCRQGLQDEQRRPCELRWGPAPALGSIRRNRQQLDHGR